MIVTNSHKKNGIYIYIYIYNTIFLNISRYPSSIVLRTHYIKIDVTMSVVGIKRVHCTYQGTVERTDFHAFCCC